MLSVKYKTIFAQILTTFILLLVFLPMLVLGEVVTKIVPCTGAVDCDFNALIKMVNNIINWILAAANVIFAISFVYGGFLYMTSGDKPGNKEKAKSILWSTLTGFVIILVAWLVVRLILTTLVDTDKAPKILEFLKNN